MVADHGLTTNIVVTCPHFANVSKRSRWIEQKLTGDRVAELWILAIDTKAFCLCAIRRLWFRARSKRRCIGKFDDLTQSQSVKLSPESSLRKNDHC